MKAYHGDPDLKARTIEQIRKHREADELVQGLYWEDGKGCAVGCLTHDPDGGHHRYPERVGIPESMAHLEDTIFEGLPEDKAKEWPERFLTAIPVGADWTGIEDRLAVARLRELLKLAPKWDEARRQQTVEVIEGVIDALEGTGDREAAYSAARTAARSAESVEWAESAACAAWSAAYSAARTAACGAWSAAYSARAADSAARATYQAEADRLIAELERLPVEVAA